MGIGVATSGGSAAAIAIATNLGLDAADATVVQESNKLTVRLTPCDVLARVAVAGHEVAEFEVELAQLLANSESPVARLEQRVPPGAYEYGGFVVTLWTYYPPSTAHEASPAAYADALGRLHRAMGRLDIAAPHFLDRVDEAEHLVASRDRTPALVDDDRQFLGGTLRDLRRTLGDSGAAEQLLHGEPHPGNVLNTKDGLVFIDLETCCRGPVEFDLAHVSESVSDQYAAADHELIADFRQLVIAMVAAWRWDRHDRFPDGRRWRSRLLGLLRDGAPWPTLGDLRLP